jgi:hypothetical protein
MNMFLPLKWVFTGSMSSIYKKSTDGRPPTSTAMVGNKIVYNGNFGRLARGMQEIGLRHRVEFSS